MLMVKRIVSDIRFAEKCENTKRLLIQQRLRQLEFSAQRNRSYTGEQYYPSTGEQYYP